MTERIPQSTAKRVMFMAFLASDGKTPATGKTIAITISKNGGAFGNPNAGATNATAVSSGWYYVDLDTTDTATLGPLAVRGAEGTIDDVGILFDVVTDMASIAAILDDTGTTGVVIATASRPGIRKNTALAAFEFPMLNSTTEAGETGATVTAVRSVDGGAFGAGTLSAVSEVGNGVYAVDFGAGDLNGNVITLRATATGCKDTLVTIKTSP